MKKKKLKIVRKEKTQERNENRFNLIDEQWIPVANAGLVSLSDIFSNKKLRALGGNPVQKIAILKLLLAIAQSAYTPKDDDDWAKLGADGVSEKSLAYLKKNKDCFWLYGENPFLQMPMIKKAAKQPYGALMPEIAMGNTTVLKGTQVVHDLSDAEKATLVVQLMGFGLGGKTDNSVILSKGYQGKFNEKGNVSTGKPGASLGTNGFLHSFLTSENIISTLWLNMLTKDVIKTRKIFSGGLGIAPWDKMPTGETCSVADELKKSVMGRLVPLSQFILISNEEMHCSDGIIHFNYKEDGVVDPSVTIDNSDIKVLWVDPNKRPWRQLTSLLSFIESEGQGAFECLYLKSGIARAKKLVSTIGIWSGGIKVSGGKTSKQYVSGTDDYVESELQFKTSWLGGGKDIWFPRFKIEMTELDACAKMLYATVMGYHKTLKSEGKQQAAKATNLFWQLCERKVQTLVDACPQGKEKEDERKKLRKIFAEYVRHSFDAYCLNDTARQMEAWAKCKPNLGKYLHAGNV